MTVVALQPRRAPVADTVHLPLSMAQLSPAGLSEQWFLRHCGDMHWTLIARALGQRSAVFQARDGRAVYAAFCATSLRFHPLAQSLLGAEADVESTLQAVSDIRTGSVHRLTVDGQLVAELTMISTFVSHDTSGSNRRIVRNTGMAPMVLEPAGDALRRLDILARDTARDLRHAAPLGAPVYCERPAPMLDFNAVGLLYFPTFSRLAETADYARSERLVPVMRRDVVYLGNLDQGDSVKVYAQGAAHTMTRHDGTLIAVVRTRRDSAG